MRSMIEFLKNVSLSVTTIQSISTNKQMVDVIQISTCFFAIRGVCVSVSVCAGVGGRRKR